MKTIGEVLQLSGEFLKDRNIERPKRLAEEILSHVLRMQKMELFLQYDKPIIENEIALIRESLKRCAKGEPFEYTVGEVEFFGCKIKVDRRVLIPRPETEILVEMITNEVKQGVLWDLCTGSGCIGISLKKNLPELDVTLSDISPGALSLAAENAERNGVKVCCLLGDLLAPFAGKKADFIVCNPPYISEGEYASLDPSVRDFEPKEALIGGEKGTEFYERLQQELPLFLNPGAKVFLEIGSSQGEAVKQIFSHKGELLRDWAGHPRFFSLEMQ